MNFILRWQENISYESILFVQALSLFWVENRYSVSKKGPNLGTKHLLFGLKNIVPHLGTPFLPSFHSFWYLRRYDAGTATIHRQLSKLKHAKEKSNKILLLLSTLRTSARTMKVIHVERQSFLLSSATFHCQTSFTAEFHRTQRFMLYNYIFLICMVL